MCLSADGKVAFITGPQLRSQDVEIGRVDIENPLAPVVIGWTEIRAEQTDEFPFKTYSNASTLVLHKSGDYLLANYFWREVVGRQPNYYGGGYIYGDSGGGIVFDIRNGSFEVASHSNGSLGGSHWSYKPSSDQIVTTSWIGSNDIVLLDWQQPTSPVIQSIRKAQNQILSDTLPLGLNHFATVRLDLDNKFEVYSLTATDTSELDRLQAVKSDYVGGAWASNGDSQEFVVFGQSLGYGVGAYFR